MLGGHGGAAPDGCPKRAPAAGERHRAGPRRTHISSRVGTRLVDREQPRADRPPRCEASDPLRATRAWAMFRESLPSSKARLDRSKHPRSGGYGALTRAMSLKTCRRIESSPQANGSVPRRRRPVSARLRSI